MRRSWKFIAIAISGLCWYLSFHLSGNFWYLLWIAPIPVLLVSFHASARQSFAIAGIAYLIGRLSWLPYLLTVLPAILAILFTVLLPLVFAIVIVLTRKIVLNQNSWSVFAFPVLWSLFEFLLFKLSADGTAGSIAYSEANCLPVIQLACVTGILGISFLVTLFPSAVALAIYNRHKRFPVVIAFALIASSILFGVVRINKNVSPENDLTVGLAVADEKFHSETDHPKAEDEIRSANMYAAIIARLAQQGAQVVVLPEKMISIKDGFGDSVKNIILNAARDKHAAVIAGYTAFVNDSIKHNNAWVISQDGSILADYQKVNLFEGEAMNNFVPGDETATFNLNNTPSGTAICKDMDYQDFMRKYAVNETRVLFIPAWDFMQDGWLHSRMAVLRGVENGYAVIRSARQGRLTVSDYRGRVLSEASCENNKAATLVAKIDLTSIYTVYSHFGDWFGYVIVFAAVYFFVTLIRKKTAVPKK